jgi:antitoxin component YwqK of YwqJK toxin-antitoxin module
LFGCKTEYRKTIDSYSDGQTKVEYIYPDKNDTTNYSIIEYYDNGQISFKGTVENSKFVGIKLNYYPYGNLKEVDSIINPCDLNFCCCDAKVSKYYSNGKLDQTYENRNGMTNGLVYLYENDSSGKLGIIYTYKDDKKHGTYKNFYNSGELYRLGTYRNDTLVDFIYYFEPNGDTMKINYTWKGKEDFPSKKWLDNGEIFYATYLDTTYNKALYRWTDKAGKELRREIVSPKTGGEWITSNGKWITPN